VALRQSPSSKSKILRRLAANTNAYEIRKKGRWVRVSLKGSPDVGWLPLAKIHSTRILYEQAVKLHTFGQPAKAVVHWRKLAKLGHGKSQLMLGRMYLDGDGVAKNYQQAIFWSKKALAQGMLSDKVRGFTQQTIRRARRNMSDIL